MKPSTILAPLLCALLLSACASGGSGVASSREAGRYSHRMHNRFYEGWVQPRSVAAPHGKISVPVDVQIDGAGRVQRFRIAKSSGYAEIDESVRDVGRRITKVAPPPVASPSARFDLRIFFELDVKR